MLRLAEAAVLAGAAVVTMLAAVQVLPVKATAAEPLPEA
jgi:hypothetical protein